MRRTYALWVGIVIIIFACLPARAYAFTFAAWGDTKSDTSVLKNLSPQIKALNPVFTIYSGDLVDRGFSQGPMDTWKTAINGGTNNGLFDITFPVRGNHDASAPDSWTAYFDFAAAAGRVGAINYTELNTDLTYSYDYGNSRFLAVDVTGDASRLTSAQISWIDSRLTDAESKGLTHAFIYFHGPIYCVAEHCSCSTTTGCVSSAAISLIDVINKHPIVTATFHGHEHVVTYTNLTSTRIPQLTRELHEFVSGDAGAGPDTVKANRTDYVMTTSDNKGGFVFLEVNGAVVTANFYRGGVTTPVYKVTINKSGSTISPNPTPTSGSTPARTPTPIRTPTPTPTGTTSLPGDLDSNRKVDIFDYNLLVTNFGKTGSVGFIPADIDKNGKVDIFDFNILVTNFGKIAAHPTPAPSGSSSPSYEQVKTWVEAYKAAHPGNGGKDWDINAKTPAQIARDPAAKQLLSLCGQDQRPVIPLIAWEYGGNDHPWINPAASALVYCVYIPVNPSTSHWKYDAAAGRVTADVYVLFPNENPCNNRIGKDQVIACLGDGTNSEILVDTVSLNDGNAVGLNLAEASTLLNLIMPDGTKVQLLLNL